MELFGVGTTELVVVLLLAAIVLGPERLARTARELGKFTRNARAYLTSFSDELKGELDVLDDLKKVEEDLRKTNLKL
jgi:sec-independent protein translocase protein TatB